MWQLFTSAMVSSRQNSNSSSVWNVLPSSERQFGQDKTVYVKTRQFCPVSKCGVNWILSCLDLVSNLQLFSLKYMYTCRRVCIICCQTNATRQWQADCVMPRHSNHWLLGLLNSATLSSRTLYPILIKFALLPGHIHVPLYFTYSVLYYSTTCCNPATGCYMIMNNYKQLSLYIETANETEHGSQSQ